MSTEKYQISVNGLIVDVVRRDIKNLHLGVYPPAGRVRVAAPLRVNDEAVRLFTSPGWAGSSGSKRNSRARNVNQRGSMSAAKATIIRAIATSSTSSITTAPQR